jgi:hypothetical protein
MSRRNSLFGPTAACATAVLVGSARGDSIDSTGFENPPFAAGSQLSGQGGWSAPSVGDPAGFPFNLNPGAAIVLTANPLAGTQSVQVLGSNLQVDSNTPGASNGVYAAIGSSVGSDATGLGELAISSDGMVHAYTGDDSFPTFLFSAPITLCQYHTLAVADNFAAQTSSFHVDGALLGTAAFASDDVLASGSFLAYAGTDTSDFQKANYAAYYDNFSISAVPEPGGLVLIGIGAAAPMCLGRRSRIAA